MRKHRICGALTVLTLLPAAASAFDDGLFEPEIPEVLTPVRLQQPLAEVPASVTVITDEQIRLWGVKDIASVFRFVPGMFVAHEMNTNTSTVLYHSGDVVLARRLEVLVDGRSVYNASFANVNWNLLNIPLEDIARIEITRGPSAASYGMNAFQGVIHIITRHPADSVPAVLAVDAGVEHRARGYASVAVPSEHVQSRLSVYGSREGSNNDYHADSGDIGGFPDGVQNAGIHWSGAWQADADSSLRWQLGRERLLRDLIADSNFQAESPLEESVSDMAWLRWRQQSSADHEWQLQAYWQGNNTEASYTGCVPTMTLDPSMRQLYTLSPDLAEVMSFGLLGLQNGSISGSEAAQINQLFAALAAGAIDAQQLESLVASLRGKDVSPVSDDAYLLARQVATDVVAADAMLESVCGTGELDIYEQRLDIELQDTRRWSDSLRSVQGIGFRQDEVSSEVYMNGTVRETQWMAFVNLEYRPLPELITSFGLMGEYRKDEEVRFSPRLGVNYLLGEQQSLRFQIAQSRRTPDLAERYLDATVTLSDLDANYLNLEEGSLFYRAQATDFDEQLQDEKILAIELGYFRYFSDPSVQLDIKLFREQLSELISSHIALRETTIENHGSMTLLGLEGQVNWQPLPGHGVLLGWLLQDRQADDSTELNLGAENSLRLSWTHQSGAQEQMLGFLWDLNRNEVGGGTAQGRYRQQVVMGRWAFDTVAGNWSISTEYNPLAGAVLYERTPRWLSRAGWRYSW